MLRKSSGAVMKKKTSWEVQTFEGDSVEIAEDTCTEEIINELSER